MNLSSNVWMGSDLSDEAFAELAQQLLARDDVALLPNLLVVADRHREFWPSEEGQAVLAGILNLLVETLDAGDVAGALAAMQVCPAPIAQQAHDLLLLAFFPDGEMGDPADLYDSALLCLAMLLGASGQREAVGPFLDRVGVGRDAGWFQPPAQRIRDHFAPPPAEAFKPKLIVWDLDDTLWQGTLADGDTPVLHAHRADYVRAFNRHGIVSAICSKNDFAAARAVLEQFGLWEEFVFPRIAFVPKGAVIRQMIADMQLRAVNVLFVDDNPHNLHEVAAAVPGIHVVDANSPECDALLRQILDDHAHVEKSRVADYRLLATKVAEREDNALSDADFLRQSDIQATFTYRMDNLEFADRIAELINRSNQLNYTQSRTDAEAVRRCILDIDHYEVFSVFLWDKYGYYGLVGIAIYAFRTRTLEHFAFSCRIMHMGVEDFLIRRLRDAGHVVDGAQLRKPLPPQSADAIAIAHYNDPAVRARVLAEEAPRDWSKVRLRLMADCQSGAFHHYSRFQDEIDFDNAPRLFSLPMMKTGAYAEQAFPPCLVYTAASDYLDWRWTEVTRKFDTELFAECVDRFVEMVVAGGHRVQIFLPPQDLPIKMFALYRGCDPEKAQARHPLLNDLWRVAAARHPEHFTLVELAEVLVPEELVHAHHYVPSALKRIAGMIDDWYAGQSRR